MASTAERTRASRQQTTRRMDAGRRHHHGHRPGLRMPLAAAGAALPNCGGNNDIKISPVLVPEHADHRRHGVHRRARGDSAGGAITASYSLAAPRAVDTPIRMRAHRGISSNTEVNEAAGIIPAGATSATLTSQTAAGRSTSRRSSPATAMPGAASRRRTSPTASDCATTPTTSTPPSTEQPVTTTAAPTTVPTGGGTTPTSARSRRPRPPPAAGPCLSPVPVRAWPS